MSTTSFWDHPIDKLEEALNLKKQIHALQQKLSSLFGSDEEEAPKRRAGFAPLPSGTATPVKRGPGRPRKNATTATSPVATPAKRGRKPFSAETKAKMAAAQRARWAGKSGASAGPAPKAAKPGKRTVSPEVRARLAAAMKARWAAAKKKGLPGPNARK